ncbi:integrase catalytic domain-containing protein [Trichonephila clavipes]|nr:integrase catalytic domain-containing protein [Trichonephila clavipes]
MNRSVENKSCIVCKDKTLHPIFRCKRFLELNPEKRLDLVRLHKLCELCLRKNHKRMQCTSTYVCPCGKKHSRSLCTAAIDDRKKWVIPSAELPVLTNPEDRESNVVDSSTQNTVLSSTASQHRKNVLISTGSVFLRNNEGRELKCPVIFDSASNINIISRKMCDFLGIAIEKINSSVSGLNSLKQNLKGKTNTLISNKSGTFRENVEFFVTEKITGLTPSVTIIKDNVYKVNKELLFRETEFGWIAGGRLQGTNTNNFSCYFLKDNDSIDDTLKLFFELESLGIKDDPCYRKDDQAMNIFKETVQYNNNRYVVELPFRKHWNELSNNISVAKQRFQSLWGRLRRDKTLYTQYKETIQDYLNQGIIEKVNDTEINVHKPMYYLPHQAIKKEGRVTTSTHIVFDAASHQANELSLNDCLWPGPNLNPNLLDVLINFRLNRVAISSDIRQAFLQICLADKHKDFVRFLWTDSNPRIGEKLTLQVYRFNRVIFGVNSSPFLLAATIKYHIEKYNEIHPITVQHLDSFMYVDDWITGQDTREEALFMSRHAKNIIKEAGMEMRKWISNDTVLMAQGRLKVSTHILWMHPSDNLRIPRLVLDSANDEVSDLIEIHIFCDASKLAYGAAAYVKVRKQNEVLVNLIASKTRVAPLKAVTLPRLELLGALVAARLSSRVQEIVRKKKECKVFHWTDSKIVLFWIKGSSKRWKQFVANRVQEISELTDPDSWFHCSGQDNPSDFLSRGLSVDTLISNNKWWTDPAFLRTDELPKTVSECPELNEVDYLPELKSKDSKEYTVLTLNFNQTFFDHLLSRSNKFLTIVRVLSFLYRFLFNIRNPTNKKTGPLTSDEMKEAEIYLMKQVQLSSFYKEIRAMQNGDDICNKSKILNLSPFLDDKGIIRVGGRLKHSRLPYSSKHPILLPAKSANREIKALSKLVRDREESLFAFFAKEGIEWSFIPPRSPNWGGLWEANIKSLKYHFKRVAGNSKFSYEELLTLITQIEAILNSRPLTPLSSDVDDLEVLTPAHFLIGRPITAIVEPSLLQCESNRLNVWQRITKSVQTIWKRWSLSYLNSLQQRKKWIVNKENLKLGDMVLIREENLPPCKWLLGRVVKIYMGKDKKVRVVDIKTGKGIYKRSINRLSILPIEN